jgi:multisubunit Na+/H+ antiporter MnhG subunit
VNRARYRLIRLLATLITPVLAVLLAIALRRDGVRVETDVVYG